MSAKELETRQFEVPIDTGYLIGNTLRQFAMRGAPTWQVAAYKVGSREGSFGIAGNVGFSCNDLFRGILLCEDDGVVGDSKNVRFTLDGDRYRADGEKGPMYIEQLGNLGLHSMQVCLVYASGTRTVEQNYETAKRIFGKDDSGFFAVSSRHVNAVAFRYEVIPKSLSKETLSITATSSVISDALESAQMILRNMEQWEVH